MILSVFNDLALRITAVFRLTKTTYPDNSNSQTEYDKLGRVSAEIDQRGNRTDPADPDLLIAH